MNTPVTETFPITLNAAELLYAMNAPTMTSTGQYKINRALYDS
jgi:hypothetical protein